MTYGYGQPAVTLRRAGWSPEADQTYRVRLNFTNGDDVQYEVTPVTCP